MSFQEAIPVWNAPGVEPPQSLKDSGWVATDKPPAEYFNWYMNTTYLALQELRSLVAEKTYVDQQIQIVRDYADNLDASDVGAETPENAQAKANAAEESAKKYTDTHEAKNNPHNITVEKIGAETPEEAQRKADDAEQLSKEYTDAHENKSNPHNITPEKIGAETPGQSQDRVDTHAVDYIKHPAFGVTSGSNNEYSVTLDPPPTSYTDGLGIVIALNESTTGASTLNINSLGPVPLKKANGSDATNLKANGVYTFRYHSGAFTLQGEGGEGTATPSDVRAGETFTNDNGVFTGSMIDQGAYNITPSTTNQAIPQGIHNGSGVVYGDPDLVVANIRNGVSLFGVQGKNTVIDTERKAGFAYASDVLNGQKFFMDGIEVTGTMPNKSGGTPTAGAGTWQNSNADNQVTAIGKPPIGYYDGETDLTIAITESSLKPSNIKGGASIFGVSGKSSVVETGDADANAATILENFSAYVNGDKLNGTIKNFQGSTVEADNAWYGTGFLEFSIPETGYYWDSARIRANDPDLKPENIKEGVSVFGMSGTMKEFNSDLGEMVFHHFDHAVDGGYIYVKEQSYVKAYELEMIMGGNYKVEVQLGSSSPNSDDITTAQWRINGNNVGSAWSINGQTSQSSAWKTTTFSLDQGDKLQLYLKYSNPGYGGGRIHEFIVKGDIDVLNKTYQYDS